MKVDNAIILAAGTSSRFAPLSYERHKAMTIVRGEVLIERQIEQLQAAGVPEIYIVAGHFVERSASLHAFASALMRFFSLEFTRKLYNTSIRFSSNFLTTLSQLLYFFERTNYRSVPF